MQPTEGLRPRKAPVSVVARSHLSFVLPIQLNVSFQIFYQKRDEVKYAQDHSNAQACKKYKVAESTLYGWEKINF